MTVIRLRATTSFNLETAIVEHLPEGRVVTIALYPEEFKPNYQRRLANVENMVGIKLTKAGRKFISDPKNMFKKVGNIEVYSLTHKLHFK